MSLEVEGKAVDGAMLARPQVRLALAFLVIERHRAVSRHELADVLWAGTLPTTWEAALRGVVSKVRAMFASLGLPAEEVIPGSFGFYQLHLPPAAIVDIDEAASLLARAEAALRARKATEAAARAEEARVLAGRSFLPGEEGEWVERVRNELRSLLLRALEVLSEARLALGHPASAAEAAEAVLALDVFRESAHRLLIAAHAAAGNRGDALHAYERCRRVLAEELGVSPSAETEDAYVALLGEEPRGDTAPDEADTTGVGTSDLPQLGHRLVGREREQARLGEAWRRAKDGRRQLVLLSGEAGIGKSALALDIAAVAEGEGATVLYGRCDREVWTPYAPFVEALARYISACPLSLLRQHLAGPSAPLARLIPEVGTRLPEGDVAGGGDPELERHRLFVAATSFLASVATTRPVLLVIDDLQWAGTGGLLLLRYAARALASLPLLIVAAYRPEEAPAAPILGDVLGDLAREPGVVHVEVQGLDDAAVAQLVHRTAGPDVPTEFVARLRDAAAGNPLFLTELLREHPDGSAAPIEAADHLGVPAAVCRLVKLRRSRLPERTNRVLSVAAVLGAEFEVDTLQRVTGLDGDATLDALDEAAAAGLVREAEVVAWYRFRHHLVRDAVYGELSQTRRARLHSQVGQVLEERDDLPVSARAPEVAHHFCMAGPLGPLGKAVDWVLRAGEVAIDHLAYEQAANLYLRALDLVDAADQAKRCQVLIALAGALRKAGRVGAARASYLEAVQLARALDDPVALAHCALGLSAGGQGVSAWIADEVRVGLLEEALAGLGEGESECRAKVLAELAKALYFAEEHHRRDRVLEEAVSTARRVGSPAVLAEALSATRVLRWGPANTELRLACAEEMVDLGARAGDRELALRARLGRLSDLLEMGEREAFDSEVREVAALAEALQQPYYLWRARAWQATQTLVRGEMAEAEARTAAAQQVWGHEVHADAVSWLALFRAMRRLAERRPAEAIPDVRDLAAAYPVIPAYRCLSALVHAAAGRSVEAWAEFEQFAADGFTRPPIDSQWLFAAAALAESCALLVDGARAEALFELLVPFADRWVVLDAFGGGGGFRGPVAYALGRLAATLGRQAEAQDRFEQAAAAAVAFRAPPWVLQAEQAAAAARRRRSPVGAGCST